MLTRSTNTASNQCNTHTTKKKFFAWTLQRNPSAPKPHGAVFLFLLASGLQSLVNGCMSSGLVSTGTWNRSASTVLNTTSMLAFFLSPTPTHQYADLVVGLFASEKMAGGSCLSCRPGGGNRNQTTSSLIDTFPSSMQVGLEPLFVVVTMC